MTAKPEPIRYRYYLSAGRMLYRIGAGHDEFWRDGTWQLSSKNWLTDGDLTGYKRLSVAAARRLSPAAFKKEK